MASILLIDDDANVRSMTSELLRLAGHTVATADDGRQGLTAYQADLYDLVITDIVMPDMDGLELIGRLRQLKPGPRIIAMSGGSTYRMPVYLPVAKNLGVERILAKPFGAEVLLRTVTDVLAEPMFARSKLSRQDDGELPKAPA